MKTSVTNLIFKKNLDDYLISTDRCTEEESGFRPEDDREVCLDSFLLVPVAILS